MSHSSRTNIVNFERYKKDKHLDPLIRYERLVRDFVRDLNISTEPTLTATQGNVILLTWESKLGVLTVTIEPTNGMILIDAHTKDGNINLKNVTGSLADHNRWIGYLFDDNMR